MRANRWKKASEEERKEHSRKMNAARWPNGPKRKEERKEHKEHDAPSTKSELE